MPVLYILGGANGVGKTTWYQTEVEKKFISHNLPFINVDNIVVKELNRQYSPANIELADPAHRLISSYSHVACVAAFISLTYYNCIYPSQLVDNLYLLV